MSRRLSTLIEAIPDLVLALDRAGRVVDVQGAERFGFAAEALIGRTTQELGLPPPRTGTADAVMLWPDGSRAAVEVRIGEGADHFVAVVRRRSVDAEDLRAANAFLDAVVENIPDMIFVKDAESLAFQRFNRAGEELLGWRREELLGRSDHDFYPKAQADFFHLKDRETLRGRRMVDIPEEPIETRQNGLRWLHTRKVPVLDAEGNPKYLLGISEDITRRKQIEEELKAANAFLDAVVENIPDMVFVKDAQTLAFKRFNRAGEELLGWTRAELLGKTDTDFYPREQAEFFHAKDRETLRNKRLVDVPEEPITTRKGLRWLHTRKVPVLDEQGNPRYLLGISEDITRRKEAEERAHSLERELASVLVNARDAVISWSLDGTVTSWNAAAGQLYGTPVAAALGANIRDLIADEALSSLAERQAALVRGEPAPPIDAYRFRNGKVVEVEESLFAIRDQGGSVVRIASIARDIGEVGRLRRATEILGAAVEPGPEPEPPPPSSKMAELLETVRIVAADPIATILILGETGVGKNWLARKIHASSPRAQRPFFELNCASLDAQLAESELFGHERGAFTGATQQQRGVVEASEGGTLFLDEVGELALGVQARLLAFLESKTFRRVGGTRSLTADVRVIAATNAELKEAVKAGTFRRDLYYRLSVLPLELPPLRERTDEIPGLAKALLVDLCRRGSFRGRATMSRKAAAALRRYDWPGNVRELRNALERALILSRGATIDLMHLPPELRGEAGGATDSMRLDELEHAQIQRALAQVKGNRTRAASLLGISRSTLKRKLRGD